MISSFLFAALLFFICSVPLFYLQRSSFLFAAFLFLYLQRFPFLFAALLFCLQRFFFVCSVPFLFAAFLFCLQRFFFVCNVSFLFAAFLFCLQRFFFVCSVSLVGHRRSPPGLVTFSLSLLRLHLLFICDHSVHGSSHVRGERSRTSPKMLNIFAKVAQKCSKELHESRSPDKSCSFFWFLKSCLS